jgi:hypothetical protein
MPESNARGRQFGAGGMYWVETADEISPALAAQWNEEARHFDAADLAARPIPLPGYSGAGSIDAALSWRDQREVRWKKFATAWWAAHGFELTLQGSRMVSLQRNQESEG